MKSWSSWKKEHFLGCLLCLKKIFVTFVVYLSVLSELSEHAYFYISKTLLHTLFCLFLKYSKAFSVSLTQKLFGSMLFLLIKTELSKLNFLNTIFLILHIEVAFYKAKRKSHIATRGLYKPRLHEFSNSINMISNLKSMTKRKFSKKILYNKIERFAKIVNGWKPLRILAKCTILDIWQGVE